MKILFLAPYPFDTVPSQRFRFEQYFRSLRDHPVSISFHSFYTRSLWQGSLRRRNMAWILPRIIWAGIVMFVHALRSIRYDYIFIHRELAPAGPPVLEWMIAKIFRKKIIYDFDDAIWLTDDSNRAETVNKIKWSQKVAAICRWSYKVSCGNEYLRGYALKFNPASLNIPTTVDTENHHNRLHTHREGPVVVGWTGSHTTLKYLYSIERVLENIAGLPQYKLVVICNTPPEWNINNFAFIPWIRDREIEDLLTLDIGLMPMPEDPWTLGKCGFKAIQYLSLGIPALVSPLPVNREIVDHGRNGYYCSTPEDWMNYLAELAGDPSRRKRFGEDGREKIIRNYSTVSGSRAFLGLFE